jgi:hypothetical protein
VTSRRRTGKTIIFFYSVSPRDAEKPNPLLTLEKNKKKISKQYKNNGDNREFLRKQQQRCLSFLKIQTEKDVNKERQKSSADNTKQLKQTQR